MEKSEKKLNTTEYSRSRSDILWYFLDGSKRYFILCIICAMMTSLMDLIAPKIVGAAVDIITGDLAENTLISRFILLFGDASWLRSHLYILAVIIAVIAVFGFTFRYLYNVYNSKGAETLVERMRNCLFSRLQFSKFTWYSENRTGDLIQRCTSDVETVKTFLSEQLTSIFRIVLLIIFALYFMYGINVKLAVISTVFIPIIFIYSFLFHRRIGSTFQYADEQEGILSTIAQENLTGVRVVKAFGKEKYERDKFSKQNEIYTNAFNKLNGIISVFWSIGDLISNLQVLLIVVFGAVLAIKGSFTVGDYIAFITYNSMLVWPVRMLARVIAQMSKAGVSVDRLNHIMSASCETSNNNLKPAMSGDIVFDHVSFSYTEDEQIRIFDDISFTVKGGKTLGILGGTGSGKSTLTALIDRFYDISDGHGSITIDGVDIKDIDLKYLRENIGLVLQEPYLFSKTLAENISIAKEDASDSDINRAIQISHLDHAIDNFEKGCDTIVGERGVTLSGGQKQRTAIASMIIRDTPIMIFDDSLSAVDAETDAKIRSSLNSTCRGKTVIIISHRISTIRDADDIIVLHNGKIAQEGTHDSLINDEGIYRKICQIQSVIPQKEVEL